MRCVRAESWLFIERIVTMLDQFNCGGAENNYNCSNKKKITHNYVWLVTRIIMRIDSFYNNKLWLMWWLPERWVQLKMIYPWWRVCAAIKLIFGCWIFAHTWILASWRSLSGLSTPLSSCQRVMVFKGGGEELISTASDRYFLTLNVRWFVFNTTPSQSVSCTSVIRNSKKQKKAPNLLCALYLPTLINFEKS